MMTSLSFVMTYSIVTVVFLFGIFSANAADITSHYSHSDQRLTILLEGMIEKGDYNKIVSLINYHDEHDKYFYRVEQITLASAGGDLAEAMKIGHLVRELRWKVEVPSFLGEFESGLSNDEKNAFARKVFHLKDPKNFQCASSCFFIYAGGVYRDGRIVGIHRPYLSDIDYATMDGNTVLDKSKSVKSVVEKYLSEMGINSTYCDAMFSVQKDSIRWLTKKETDELSGFIPELADWAISKCGTFTDAVRASRPMNSTREELLKSANKLEEFYTCQDRLLSEMRSELKRSHDAGMVTYDEGNYATAYKELKSSAEQGNTDAQLRLTSMYYQGKGVSQDYAGAAKWARKLAELGNAEGQFGLGLMYEKGQGIPQDYTEAVKWYQKAADQRYIDAWFNLGVMYDNGRGLPQDHAEAAKLYRQSAFMGNTEAYSLLYEKFKPLADQGNPQAQYELGQLYATLQGEWQNYTEAVKWYRQAADQGHADAQCSLADMYEVGHGVSEDYMEAMKWYRKAAEQGQADAQCRLGGMYADGSGVAQDYVQAHMWYNLAAAQGNFLAGNLRDSVAKKMTPSQIAEAQRLVGEWKPKGNAQSGGIVR